MAGIEDLGGLGHRAFGRGERRQDGIAAELDDGEEIVALHFVDLAGEGVTDDFADRAGDGLGLVDDEDHAQAVVEPDEARAGQGQDDGQYERASQEQRHAAPEM